MQILIGFAVLGLVGSIVIIFKHENFADKDPHMMWAWVMIFATPGLMCAVAGGIYAIVTGSLGWAIGFAVMAFILAITDGLAWVCFDMCTERVPAPLDYDPLMEA